MANDNFSSLKLEGAPKLNFSHTANLASGIQAQIEENNTRALKLANEAYKNRQKMQQSIEQTAINTADTNVQLQKVVENQISYIDLLMDQLSTQKQQLELDEQQLTILKNIFASGEDAMAVEREIMKLIQDQIDSRHPLWDFVKDKGGDTVVAGVTAGAPVIYSAFKMYLASKGILLP